MKKDYNRVTTSDMPMDTSFTPSVEKAEDKKKPKAKINVIGKNTANKAKTTVKAKTQTNNNLRDKLSNSANNLSDLDKLNEENIKNYRFKNKRNKVVIVILSLLLVLTISAFVVYSIIARLDTNCNMYAHGVSATFFINGEELSEFRAPSNLQANAILNLNIEIEVKGGDEYYNVKFIPLCYQKGDLIKNTLVYEHNTSLFRDGRDGYYYSKSPIKGNQRIRLCGGIILDSEYEKSLNVDNFRLDFHVYFEEV